MYRSVFIAANFLTPFFLFTMLGCASLRPYTEILEEIPEERIVEFEGQKIYVEQRGSGSPLLLLHGFAASAYSFRAA